MRLTLIDQSQNTTARYLVAGLGVLALLIVIDWLALREPPASTNEQPVRAITAAPRDHHIAPPFEPADDAQQEALVVEPVDTSETNAAALYRQAFALYEALTNEQKAVVSNWRTNVDPSVEAELCEKIRPICELMHQAAAVTNCDWEVEKPITFETKLPHLRLCRAVARAAVWSVAHCRTGDPARAVDDLVASSRMGHHLSPGVIGHLVDLAIQGMAIDAVTAHASTLAGAGDTRLDLLFTDTHCEEGLYQAIEQEADILSNTADKLAAMPRDEMMHVLKSVADGTPEFQAMDPDQAIAAFRQAVDLEREYAKVLGSSEAEYHLWLARLQDVQKTNPFVTMILPSVDGTLADRTRVLAVKSAMAAAGLAVMRDGTGALQSHPDPATGQPFVYTETVDGFELQSNSSYQIMDKPLKLLFK